MGAADSGFRHRILSDLERRSEVLQQDTSKDAFHLTFGHFVNLVAQMPQPRVLELGSYQSLLRPSFPTASAYVGVDIRTGAGVDVVGDLHQLGTLLADQPPFDAVVSISVFEHLVMPWVVALQINRVLRVGGLVAVTTHPAWPPHELPWDFWRFMGAGFTGLFNPHTGFVIRECVTGLPAVLLPLGTEGSTKGMVHHDVPLGICVIAEKIGPPRADLAWPLSAADVLTTHYPVPAADPAAAAGPPTSD